MAEQCGGDRDRAERDGDTGGAGPKHPQRRRGRDQRDATEERRERLEDVDVVALGDGRGEREHRQRPRRILGVEVVIRNLTVQHALAEGLVVGHVTRPLVLRKAADAERAGEDEHDEGERTGDDVRARGRHYPDRTGAGLLST